MLVTTLLFAQAVAVAHACNVSAPSAPAYPIAGVHVVGKASAPLLSMLLIPVAHYLMRRRGLG